jgi:two-component system cell cycle sensor histidine kinase PleC
MARVHASDALLRAGTAEGHAKAIAPASYIERVKAEPWIKRLAPLFIGIVLAVMWTGIIGRSLSERENVVASARMDLDQISALTAIDLQIATDASAGFAPDHTSALRMAVPPHGLEGGRRVYVTSREGVIIAAEPRAHLGKALDDVLGGGQVLTVMADRAGVMRVVLADGVEALASVRTLDSRRSQLAFVQPLDDILHRWRNKLLWDLVLVFTLTLVIGAMGVTLLNQFARSRQADEICDEVRRRNELVLQSGSSGLWDWDIARGRIYWSDSMFQMLGLARTSEFMSFADIAGLVHPEDANLFHAANDLIEKPDATVDNEFRLRKQDGGWLWVRARGRRIADPKTGAAHIVGIVMDISEQKALALSRATADMRVREAIGSTQEAFALFDGADLLVAANAKYQSLFRLPAAMLRSGTPRSVIEAEAGKSPPLETRMFSECMETGCRSLELHLADGRWLHVNERRTRDGGFVFVGSDITAHKSYEATLASQNDVLEHMIENLEASERALKERSRRLSELNDLYLVQKAEAEGANRAKAVFLSNMNHELRTPLNHIINFAAIMQARMFGPLGHERYEEYAGDIAKSGDYLLGVVTDILDMASIEAGRVVLERERVAVADIVEEAARKHRPMAEARGVAIDLRADGPLHVIGDRRSILQIVDNMLRNAVKYTRDGSVVGVRAKRHGGSIELFFEDNGHGIADEMIEKMGRPFEQTGSVIENGYKGSGLGFSISKSLAEMHGGGIKIRTKKGVGTIVMVTLPVDGPASMVAVPAAA